MESQTYDVLIDGLAAETTAEDVEALFAEDPNLFPLLRASLRPSKSSRDVAVLLKFAQPDHARAAIAYFDGVKADGKVLTAVACLPGAFNEAPCPRPQHPSKTDHSDDSGIGGSDVSTSRSLPGEVQATRDMALALRNVYKAWSSKAGDARSEAERSAIQAEEVKLGSAEDQAKAQASPSNSQEKTGQGRSEDTMRVSNVEHPHIPLPVISMMLDKRPPMLRTKHTRNASSSSTASTARPGDSTADQTAALAGLADEAEHLERKDADQKPVLPSITAQMTAVSDFSNDPASLASLAATACEKLAEIATGASDKTQPASDVSDIDTTAKQSVQAVRKAAPTPPKLLTRHTGQTPASVLAKPRMPKIGPDASVNAYSQISGVPVLSRNLLNGQMLENPLLGHVPHYLPWISAPSNIYNVYSPQEYITWQQGPWNIQNYSQPRMSPMTDVLQHFVPSAMAAEFIPSAPYKSSASSLSGDASEFVSRCTVTHTTTYQVNTFVPSADAAEFVPGPAGIVSGRNPPATASAPDFKPPTSVSDAERTSSKAEPLLEDKVESESRVEISALPPSLNGYRALLGKVAGITTFEELKDTIRDRKQVKAFVNELAPEVGRELETFAQRFRLKTCLEEALSL